MQKVLAAVDFLAYDAQKAMTHGSGPSAWPATAKGASWLSTRPRSDPRIDAALVSGYFASRQNVWQEPIYRNVFGLLDVFGDAELASLVAPRALVVEACRVPKVDGPAEPREGRNRSAAPGRLATPPLAGVQAEIERAAKLTAGLPGSRPIELVASGAGEGAPAARQRWRNCWRRLPARVPNWRRCRRRP